MLDQHKLCEPLNYNNLLATLSKLEYSCDPNDIHDLRLQLKGIRTIIIFCHTAAPTKFPNRKHIPEIKLLFYQLGIIRDYYQSEQLTSNFFSEESALLKAFQCELKAMRSKAEQELALLLDLTPIELLKNLIINLEHQIRKWIDKEKLDEISKKFVKRKQKKIKKLKKQKLTNEQLHEIRKELKRIHLIYDSMNSEDTQKRLKKLEAHLGNLCDLRMLKLFLKAFIKNNKHNFSKDSNVALNWVIKRINQEIKQVRAISKENLQILF